MRTWLSLCDDDEFRSKEGRGAHGQHTYTHKAGTALSKAGAWSTLAVHYARMRTRHPSTAGHELVAGPVVNGTMRWSVKEVMVLAGPAIQRQSNSR